MVKIRLMRIGTKGRPFYRVVAVDERRKRTGQYIEALGTYNPLTEPHEIILKQDRIDWWVKNGAVLSDGYLRITRKAQQRPPRKPKKEKEIKEPTTSVETKVDKKEPKAEESETPTEEAPTEEAEAEIQEVSNKEVAGDPEERSQASTATNEISEDAPEIPEGQDPQTEETEEKTQ